MYGRRVITDSEHLSQIHPAAVRLVIIGDREWWHRYLILDRAAVVEAVSRERKQRPWANPVDVARPQWCERYGGPGQSFSRPPYTVRQKPGTGGRLLRRRYLVIGQSGGMDI